MMRSLGQAEVVAPARERQVPADADGFIDPDAPRVAVVARHLGAENEARAAVRADRLDQLRHQAQPVFERAAVRVDANVAGLEHELVKQVAVAGDCSTPLKPQRWRIAARLAKDSVRRRTSSVGARLPASNVSPCANHLVLSLAMRHLCANRLLPRRHPPC